MAKTKAEKQSALSATKVADIPGDVSETEVNSLSEANEFGKVDEPEDFAGLQDLALELGITIEGKTEDELRVALGFKSRIAPKKVVKVKNLISIPVGCDPNVRAAIEKANADISLAQQKADEAKEQMLLVRKQAEAANAEIIAAAQAKQAELALTVDAKLLAYNEAFTAAQPFIEKMNAAKAELELAQQAAGIKSVKRGGNSGPRNTSHEPSPAYEVNSAYEIERNGVKVQAIYKGKVKAMAEGKFFDKFQEVLSKKFFNKAHYPAVALAATTA